MNKWRRMAEPIRPPFRPTKQQAMEIFYKLNGDSNEFPVEWIDRSYLPMVTERDGTTKTNYITLLYLAFIQRWDKEKSENYYNLLLLESSLPCKQQQFEEQTKRSLIRLRKLKEEYNAGNFAALSKDDESESGVDFQTIDSANLMALQFNSLTEDGQRDNIVFERGVGISWKPDQERDMTDCTTLMSLVKQALDEDAKRANREDKQLTPGHEIRLRVWNEQKGIYDRIKKSPEYFKKRMQSLPIKGPRATNEVDESSAFKGSQQGLGRKHKTKKRKNVRKKFKNKN